MKREQWQFLSKDNKTKINVLCWQPDGEIRAILQVAHGMEEYIERYERFALSMAEQGIMVVGNDHLGHGDSVNSTDDWGYFADKNGNEMVLQDMHTLYLDMREKYPGLPYFFLGHSMGSLFLRQFLYRFPEADLTAAIIMGTSVQPKIVVRSGRVMALLVEKLRGPRYRSQFIENIVLGQNNKSFKGESDSGADWLTRDREIVRAYVNEPRNTFLFTLRAYVDMFDGLLTLYKKDNLYKMRRDLPILITSGSDDPVGGKGVAVRKLSSQYKELGIKDVRVREYEGARHELLNEINAEEVDRDLLAFMEEFID